MSTILPGELTASAVIGMIESGGCTRDAVLTMARGFLPLEQEGLIVVLSYLAVSPDEEISTHAKQAFAELPPRVLFEFASNEQAAGRDLLRLFQLVSDPLILETLVRNRSVPDAAIAELAATAEPRIQDVIVINQARILRAPEILDALLSNPGLAPDARRRALETKEEFFVKRPPGAPLPGESTDPAEGLGGIDPELADAPLDAIADLLEKAEEAPPEPPTVQLNESEKNDPQKRAIWTRLNFMSVSEKVQLAYKGDRMVRMLLIRERNKLICSAVMRNPRMSEQEVEAVSGMRNVEDEVLRIISTRRDWISKYNIMLTLCRNPKCPIGVVLPFINRLTLRDLKNLKDDKGIQQVVRELAKKVYLARTQKAG